MKTTIIRSSAVALALAFGASLGADLIGVEPGHPLLVFNNQGTTTYDATTNLFTIDANPVAIQFAPGQPPRFVNPTGTPRDEMVFLQVIIDESGALVGGVDGDDFIVTGEVDADGDGIVDYAGVLISGEVIDFGFQDNGVASNHGTPSGHPRPKPALGGDGGDDDKMPGGKNAEPKGKGTGLGALLGTTDLYDFRIVPTGGLLLPLFGGSDLGAIVTSEMSSFNGSFLVDFSGEAKGDIGPIDPLPGACCLPDGSCDELLATDCLILGGTPFGSGTLCDDVVCIPVGACCFTDGTCDVLPQDACDA
ncbi:MAG: hypothetical protein KDA25_05245, partial [Phycisphaerales bacterium]|nr:hypothetical protein [Phycisphaerales bacterium]